VRSQRGWTATSGGVATGNGTAAGFLTVDYQALLLVRPLLPH